MNEENNAMIESTQKRRRCVATTKGGTKCKRRAYGSREPRCFAHMGFECRICFGTEKTGVIRLQECEHVFHRECLYRYITTQLSFNCPMCRRDCLPALLRVDAEFVRKNYRRQQCRVVPIGE